MAQKVVDEHVRQTALTLFDRVKHDEILLDENATVLRDEHACHPEDHTEDDDDDAKDNPEPEEDVDLLV